MIQEVKDCNKCAYFDNHPANYRQECSVTGKGVEAKGKTSTGFVYEIPEDCPFNYKEHNIPALENTMN